MIDLGPGCIMMIEPANYASTKPVVDLYTLRMTAAWRNGNPSSYSYKGLHICKCGVLSDNRDHFVADAIRTNSLCVHYLAFHREDVPNEQLELVLALTEDEVEPTEHELKDPKDFRWDSSSNDT